MSAEGNGGGWEIARRRWIVSGRVQGVGYRAFAARVGRALRLSGGAANLDDGRVLVVAEGAAHALVRLEAALGEGPRLARVDAVEAEDLPPGAPAPALDVEF